MLSALYQIVSTVPVDAVGTGSSKCELVGLEFAALNQSNNGSFANAKQTNGFFSGNSRPIVL